MSVIAAQELLEASSIRKSSWLNLKNNPITYAPKCFRSFSSKCKSYGVLCHVLMPPC
jgi:hypothetical protein